MGFSIKLEYRSPFSTFNILHLSIRNCPAILQTNIWLRKLTKMAGKITAVIVGFLGIVFVANFGHVTCTPAIATYDPLEVCIENCAQCKKMLGAWFEGPLCAESCIKFKGKLIPECEDFASISPFLNKL